MGKGRSKSAKRLFFEQFFQLIDTSNPKSEYMCVLCKKLLGGMQEVNFMSHATGHISRIHPETEQEWLNMGQPNQAKIRKYETIITEDQQFLDQICLKFAKTSLPVNFFQCEKVRDLVSEIIKYNKLPDFRTVEKHIAQLSQRRLAVVQEADYYSLQLDHWNTQQHRSVLVVSASFINKEWNPVSQIIDFKIVNKFSACEAVAQLQECVEQCGLESNRCIAFQSDNCNAMIATARKYNEFPEFYTDSDADKGDVSNEDVVIVEERQFPEIIIPNDYGFPEFTGCGAHQFNNSILEAIKTMKFFIQLNNFCKALSGPTVSATRWYKIYFQLKFAFEKSVDLHKLRNCDPENYDSLDDLAVNQMFKCHQKIFQIGKFFETEKPLSDHTLPYIRQLQKACSNSSQNPDIHDTVRSFFSRIETVMSLDKRFQTFSTNVLVCTLLNPSKSSRDFLTEAEKQEAFDEISYFQICEREDNDENVNDSTEMTKTEDAIDSLFQDAASPKRIRLETTQPTPMDIQQELDHFLESVDESICAFDYFSARIRRNRNLSKIARFFLSILPSPANCERSFLRAAMLTENPKNQLSNKCIRERLMLL